MQTNQVHKIALLKIGDTKSIQIQPEYCEFNKFRFQNAICGGNLTLLNHHIKNRTENSYKFCLDDGTGKITAFYHKNQEDGFLDPAEFISQNHTKFFDICNKYGINIRGNYQAPGSEKFNQIMCDLQMLQSKILENIKQQPTHFHLQPNSHKVIVIGSFFKLKSDETCFRIMELNKTADNCLWEEALNDFYKTRFKM